MSVLEELRPFFRVCQCVSFFPFRMEIDKKTKTFQRFSFSWRYPITWWFFIISVTQMISYYIIFSSVVISRDVEELSVIIKTSIKVMGTIYLLILLSSRYWVTFRLSTLNQAIELMHRIEQSLSENPKCKHTIKIRMFIAFVTTSIWVCMSITLFKNNVLFTYFI